jgi:hypothetical protein
VSAAAWRNPPDRGWTPVALDHDGSGEPAPSPRLAATVTCGRLVAVRRAFRRCGAGPILIPKTARIRTELATVLFTDTAGSRERIAAIGNHACFTLVHPEGDLWLLRTPA